MKESRGLDWVIDWESDKRLWIVGQGYLGWGIYKAPIYLQGNKNVKNELIMYEDNQKVLYNLE